MIVKRMGNKSKLAHKIISYFPDHIYYFEPFFGAGGLFFNKPKCKYNYLNDLDSEIYNLFMLLRDSENLEKIKEYWKHVPAHQDLYKFWKKHKELGSVERAVRFLFLSNFAYLGKQGSFRSRLGDNTYQIILQRLTEINFNNVLFYNMDFRKFLKCFLEQLDLEGKPYKKEKNKNYIENTFIYADPPYLDSSNDYKNGDFKKDDFLDLLKILNRMGCKFAVSEFDNPWVIEQAHKQGLFIQEICERKNINNRRIEILIMNYNLKPKGLFY